MWKHGRVLLNKFDKPAVEERKLLLYLNQLLHFNPFAELKFYYVILAFLTTVFTIRDAVKIGQRLLRVDLKFCEVQVVDK